MGVRIFGIFHRDDLLDLDNGGCTCKDTETHQKAYDDAFPKRTLNLSKEGYR
jgi:hypothetical protein